MPCPFPLNPPSTLDSPSRAKPRCILALALAPALAVALALAPALALAAREPIAHNPYLVLLNGTNPLKLKPRQQQ